MRNLADFQRMFELAAPAVLSLDWTAYGERGNYGFFDEETGMPVRTGVLHCFWGAPRTYIGCPRVTVHGFMSDPQGSLTVLRRKYDLVVAHGTLTSLPWRNPEKKDWGGGIYLGFYEIAEPNSSRRFDTRDDPLVSCITGLPEIADHLLNTFLLAAAGLIDHKLCTALTAPDTEGMRAAMEWARMSEEQFMCLRDEIMAIVNTAKNKVRPMY